jgi:glyoxylate reductase
MPKIAITRMIPESGIEMLKKHCDVNIWPNELPPSRDELMALVKGADGILSMLSDRLDAQVMDAAGNQLKVITNYAVGYDNIEVKAAAERGIQVGNTPGVLTETTADLAFALLMSTARRIVEGNVYVQAGKWKTWGPKLLRGYELNGKTLGIVGFGRIGKAMARRGKGFNMQVLFYSPSAPQEYFEEYNATKVDLRTLLRDSDFISLHCPLNDRSSGLFNAEVFAKMKPTSILVNTARGKVVVTEDLIEALQKGLIAGAGLDVTDPEPISMDSPLLQLENVVITPHIGSASYAARARMSEMCAENLLAGIRGKALPYQVK